MVEFLKIQYGLGRVTISQLERIVNLGRITQDDFDTITTLIQSIEVKYE